MISILGALVFGIATIIYVLLALGFPLGEFALGGKYKVMPIQFRIVCAISVLVQLFAIVIILQAGGIISLLFSLKATKMICFFFAAYLSLNSIMNALSNSKKEKFIVTPLSIIAAVCFWITAFNA
ncbi:hypothetical protein KQI88_15170 [Alkaliphilus sp. MSJ-5]|uniref:Uncharacterized protein n=1 Tax=Alkaliphilus flagellatus TaxID=2841507 RepID=A0ABS6G5V8_9FIRM|nr:hypothetical protein [Alkaliphilus flagellatus]MBU5677759.1 hypothetical protein [Alkaliphilus flagellatus]